MLLFEVRKLVGAFSKRSFFFFFKFFVEQFVFFSKCAFRNVVHVRAMASVRFVKTVECARALRMLKARQID